MAHRFGPARLKLDSLEAWNDYAGNRSESYKAKCDRYGMCAICSLTWHLLTAGKGASKRMEIMWAFHLQKLLDEENVPITVISLHPGVIGTGASCEVLILVVSLTPSFRRSTGQLSVLGILVHEVPRRDGGARSIHQSICYHQLHRKVSARQVQRKVP